MSHRIEARPPRGIGASPLLHREADAVATYLKDAAQTPGGHTPAVAFPRSEVEVAQLVKQAPAVLAVGAQSSLTGGATPFGEWVIHTSRLDAIGPRQGGLIRAGAGVPLLTLQGELRRDGYFFPPAPTFLGATVGGVVSTNAAGAATFKYGATRAWVQGFTVVLASGDVLDLTRGEVRAHEGGYFEVALTNGEVRRVPVPSYAMPDVPKCSAGYYAAPGMDLVDLFIGAEGTLGVVTEVELRLRPEPARLVGWLPLPSEEAALEAARRLRDASLATRRSNEPGGVDVSAIESMDARCLDLLREDGKDHEQRLRLQADARAALLFHLELPESSEAARAIDDLATGGTETHGPVARLCRLLGEMGVLESLEVALPGDERRAGQLLAVREAVPMAVNHRVAAAQRAGNPAVRKTAADMIVPFAALGEMLAIYRGELTRRGLDHAIWGHVSDGNLHVNVIPRSGEDVASGDAAVLEFGREAIRRGGSPLAEHGVGRNPQKQALLEMLYGLDGLAAMRAVKAALDPEGKLAPGVLWPAAR